MSELPERNEWSIARHAGGHDPDENQRLLNHASWDTFAAIGVVRQFAVAGLERAARRGNRQGSLVIGAIDDTGQERPARPPPESSGGTWGAGSGRQGE